MPSRSDSRASSRIWNAYNASSILCTAHCGQYMSTVVNRRSPVSPFPSLPQLWVTLGPHRSGSHAGK